MLFHTLDFAAFFGVVILLYGLLRGQWLLMALTGASYFFYGYIQPYYVVLLLLLTLSDYVIGLLAGRFRKRWHGVLVSFVVNFGALAYFKYSNFGLETAAPPSTSSAFTWRCRGWTWCCRSASASTSSSRSPT